MMTPLTIEVLLFTFISLVQSFLANAYVGNEAYMDEIFHYPEVVRLCQSILVNHSLTIEWNEKITTPPGLYYRYVFCLYL